MLVLIATGNAHKAAEIGRMLDGPVKEATGSDVRWVSFDDFPDIESPEEIGEEFGEIALLKARYGAAATGLITIGDDSGLAVDYLKGGPGVRSKRYSGENATDAENNAKLLSVMKDVPEPERGAAFVCALALYNPARGTTHITEGRCEGRILTEGRGSGGFGYDPLFYLSQFDRTMAELSPEEKDSVSHRGAAVRALAEAIGDLVR